MPEGPEVRKYSDALDEVLSGRVVVSFAARTKEARKWLEENERRLIGRRVERVVSHGKHLIGYIDGGLRAEILFACKLNPWLTIAELSKRDVTCLARNIPRLAGDAYRRGATAAQSDRDRMAADPKLVYQPGREYGTRHMVFRRTNLPCLRCGEKIRQLRQKTTRRADEEEERTRIVYFCPTCQSV